MAVTGRNYSGNSILIRRNRRSSSSPFIGHLCGGRAGDWCRKGPAVVTSIVALSCCDSGVVERANDDHCMAE